MDSRDDWADEVLEGDLEAVTGEESAERQSAEQIARDVRNMNAVLSAMGEQVGDGLDEGLPGDVDEQVVPLRRRPAWRRRVVVPLAAAAAIAALILVGSDENEEDGGRLAPAAPSMVSEMDVEADRPFAVFPTSDPNIAVVWLLNLEETE